MGGSRSPNRRIRFAPLPDPRRSVLITDDGNELPLPYAGFATQFPAPPTPSPTLDPRRDYFSSLDSEPESKRSHDSPDLSVSSATSTPGTATPVSITTTPTTPSEYDSVPPSPVAAQAPPSPITAVSNKLSEHAASSPQIPSSSKTRPFSSFFRFKRSSNSSSPASSTTLTPVTSIDRSPTPTSFSRRNFSAEEILTLGTINLFRASSRDTCNTEAAPSSSGWSLSRWTSISSSNSHHHHHHPSKDPSWGHPLTRASSTQSYQSKSKAAKEAQSARSRPPVSRKGTRLLNGRYYGVKPRPNNANPFANARDDEPDFVEWGYGGMGSVKNAKSSGAHGHWERLHGTTTTSKEMNEDEDEGSGMAWIKKRREQKQKQKEEKEALEREALERAESADTVPETPLPSVTPPPPPASSLLPPQSAFLDVPAPSRPSTANSARTASSSLTATPANQAPTPKASMPMLTIPLPPPPTLMVTPDPSMSTTPMPISSVNTPGEDLEHVTRAINIPAPAYHYLHHRHSRAGSKDLTISDVSSAIPSVNVETSSTDITPNTSESESSDLDEDEDEDETEEEEEEEESDEEQRQERKTALGAGVEKISRHH